MIKVLFVCHGNICRSPMAEYLFRNLINQAHLEHQIYTQSAATSQEELGNGIYPPVKKILENLDISCDNKRARQITKDDLDEFDYIIVMDDNNLHNLNYLFPQIDHKKVYKLNNFIESNDDIDDPWYTRDFNRCYLEINVACQALLEHIINKDLKNRS